MTTSTRAAPAIVRPRLVGVAWMAMVLMSRLPQIVLKELFAISASFVWMWLGVAVVLLTATYLWPGLKPLRGYLLIMTVTALITGPLDALLRNSPRWTT